MLIFLYSCVIVDKIFASNLLFCRYNCIKHTKKSKTYLFVVSQPRVGESKTVPSKSIVAAVIVAFWCRLVWHTQDQSD